ncbi:RES domain protein [Emticicia oligotrophica DSM 17448]|uniref:RES domain protein n=1 Tax=Emticicia oligotrophica (strain DSM 17448 / CIP 109782 / MTCC 6937 / GPTSA100-15) TaxID=929562 RepID=A0ABM5N6Y3_EMTOG|nr:RES family NAD+ phosphorylase [Emticicia oligotrophica]AFK05223.1 RES domain protein [Emticicia oligotrophica DSM 17448]
MNIYRITTPNYTKLTASGRAARWNRNGEFVIYAASSIALACLENIVHRSKKGLLGDFRLITIEIPKKVSIKKLTQEELPEGWSDKSNFEICQEISSNWLENLESCVLCVPSVIIPLENNFLINPQHPDFKLVKIQSVTEFTFDNRIKNT